MLDKANSAIRKLNSLGYTYDGVKWTAPQAPSGQQAEPRINYRVLYQFATGRGLSYNELCSIVRAALAGHQSERPAPAGQADTERLNWLAANGGRVKFSRGYLASRDGWCWTDAQHFHHDAGSLREAIDLAALASSQAERTAEGGNV